MFRLPCRFGEKGVQKLAFAQKDGLEDLVACSCVPRGIGCNRLNKVVKTILRVHFQGAIKQPLEPRFGREMDPPDHKGIPARKRRLKR